MMRDIDTLVTDICNTYPELAGEIASVRALVTELIENQPTVDINEAFKSRLRTKLILEANNRPKPLVAIPWWFVYTVPVGITAILLIIVYPNLATAPQPLAPTADMVSPAGSMMKLGEEEESFDSHSTFMENNEVQTKRMMVVPDYFTATFMSNSQSIKVAYATVSQPGFIVLSGPEGVVAHSELLLPGEYMDLVLAVARPVQPGVTYTATLYYDNGDSTFSTEADFGASDSSGQLISMPIVAP